MATANKPAAPPLPLLPLAPPIKPTGLRIKRKPQISKFRPKDRKRFRPRARVTESSVNKVHNDDDQEEEHDEEEKIDSKEKLQKREPASNLNKKSKKVHTSSRFSAFGRRPKPSVVGADRRREDVGAKKEEEKLEEKETTLPQRQPTTLQASLTYAYMSKCFLCHSCFEIVTHR